MSNNKQSSVEWLFRNILEIALTVTSGDSQVKLFRDARKQAKAMHREEMIDFAFHFSDSRVDKSDIEENYNETFAEQ